jgi:hypothetical protein
MRDAICDVVFVGCTCAGAGKINEKTVQAEQQPGEKEQDAAPRKEEGGSGQQALQQQAKSTEGRKPQVLAQRYLPASLPGLIPKSTQVFTFDEKGTRKWWEGRVECAHENDTYDVRYCDGGFLFERVPRDSLRLLNMLNPHAPALPLSSSTDALVSTV